MPTVKIKIRSFDDGLGDEYDLLVWWDSPWEDPPGGEWHSSLTTDDLKYAIHCAFYYTMSKGV